MGMRRHERLFVHKKKETAGLAEGEPLVDDLSEGVPVLRSTNEGVVEYIRYNNELYKRAFDKAGGTIGVSLADDGYLILPNGFIFQWGQKAIDANTINITFSIRFPNKCLNVSATDYSEDDTAGTTSTSAISTLPTQTGVVLSTYNASSDTVFWQAIGF